MHFSRVKFESKAPGSRSRDRAVYETGKWIEHEMVTSPHPHPPPSWD